MKIAILDDYQRVALHYADWGNLDTTVFDHPFKDENETIRKLQNFDIICAMRERTKFPFEVLSHLPQLKLIVSTGQRNAAIDTQACKALNIEVRYTGYLETGAPELTWALLLNLARHIQTETTNIRQNRWQTTIGSDLAGKTLGIIGLGRTGSTIARYAKAFEMKVIAWSPNLTEEKAHRAGADLVTKARLLATADFVTLHLVLSERSRHTIAAPELALLKPTAYLINTARGGLIDTPALLTALNNQTLAGAALDVYDQEPLPVHHPLRQHPKVLAPPTSATSPKTPINYFTATPSQPSTTGWIVKTQ